MAEGGEDIPLDPLGPDRGEDDHNMTTNMKPRLGEMIGIRNTDRLVEVEVLLLVLVITSIQATNQTKKRGHS